MRSRTALIVSAALVFGSACSSVPTSGQATVIGTAPTARAAEQAQIRRAGTPRQPDDTPIEVVTKFLDAEADTSKEGTALAQDYLTSPSVWDADADTLVYTSKQVELGPSTDPGIATIRVTYQLLARITSEKRVSTEVGATPEPSGIGEYRPDVRRVEQTFEVTRPEQEWLISALPRGRRINNSDLAQVFRRVVPYFYANRDFDTLVPDPVYLLKQSTNQIQRVVQRLLDGPTTVARDFLAPSLFNRETVLLTASEPEDNIVEVTFNDKLGEIRQADAPKVVAQIVWTLTAMDSGIDAVRIRVGDRPFVFDDADPEGAAQRQAQWKQFDPDAPYARRTSYFNSAGALGRYRPSSALRVGRSLGAGAGQPAVDPDASTVAVAVEVAGLRELRVGPLGSGPLVNQFGSQDDLTEPSWGRQSDGAWFAAREGDQPPQLWRVPADAFNNEEVTSTELGSRVLAFQAGPDGSRVAAIIERGGNRALEIGYIERDILGQIVRVGGFRPVVDGRNVTASSVAWLDSGKLAFTGQRGEEDPQLFTVLVDGTDLESSPGSREVLRLNRPAPAPQPQLVPIAVRPEGARRGDNSTPASMLLVINGSEVYVNRNAAWPRLTDRTRNQ